MNQYLDLSEINDPKKKKVDGLFSAQLSFGNIHGNDFLAKTRTSQLNPSKKEILNVVPKQTVIENEGHLRSHVSSLLLQELEREIIGSNHREAAVENRDKSRSQISDCLQELDRLRFKREKELTGD